MKRRSALKDPSLSIGALSRATGVPVDTLRTWERRYGVPGPTRRPSGHRAYDVEAVPHLRKIVRALRLGHRPADVLPLKPAELDALIETVNVRPSAASGAAFDPGEEAGPPALRKLLQYTHDFDPDNLRSALELAAVRLTPTAFIETVAAPFLRAVGREWSAGRLEVRHEHFASAIVADAMRDLRRRFETTGPGAQVALAMLPGDVHEAGLLMASVAFSRAGWRVLYLGPETPVEQIAAFARDADLDAVAVSVSPTAPKKETRSGLIELRRSLPGHVDLVIGGAGAPRSLAGIETVSSIRELAEWIRKAGPKALRS